MKIVTGKVVDGKIAFPPGVLEDGTPVAIVASGSDEPVSLSRAEEDALLDSLEKIRSGKFVEGDDLIRRLRDKGR